MAKGAASKEIIFAKLLETFEGSFMYNGGKELRIPMMEDGNEVQIKVALTAAKENVYPESGETVTAAVAQEGAPTNAFPEPKAPVRPVQPTEEEKANVEALLKSLGLPC